MHARPPTRAAVLARPQARRTLRRHALHGGSVRVPYPMTLARLRLWAPLVLVSLALLAPGSAVAQTRDYHFQRLGAEHGLAQSTVTAMAQDAQGFVWVGTQGGLHRYDGQRYHVFRHDPHDPGSLPDSHVTALAVEPGDADGPDRALWVGSYAQY